MTFKTRLTTAIATGAVLLNALAPIALAQEVIVTGNGASSNNTVNLTSNSTTQVAQTNNATVTNVVNSTSNTGGNNAGFNTGGDVVVHTGNATTNVSVDNAVNKNVASLDCDCIAGGNTNVTIDGNGALSRNTANVTSNNTVYLGQSNVANVYNGVTANSNSGNNSAGFNTGGDVTVHTGSATTNVGVATAANANFASLGGGSATAGNGSSVVISGNGAGPVGLSSNTVNLTQNSALVLGQSNNANVTNAITANSNTGSNTAGFNTGGDVVVHTSDATTNVGVDNLVNFNAANVDCDCILGGFGLLKIAGNGALSANAINATDNSSTYFGQGNLAALYNAVNDNSNSGSNDVSFNTTKPLGDPTVWTGNSTSNAGVSNAANANYLNNGVNVTFNVAAVWAMLQGWFV